MGTRGTPRALRFDEEARRIMTDQPRGVLDLLRHHDFAYAAPTPDHFIPLLYLAGLAGAAGEPCRTLVDGYVWGSLSMISYALGADLDDVPRTGGRAPGAGLPDPAEVPPEETNI
jgi:4,5-DOPA dioxygenase extradiol